MAKTSKEAKEWLNRAYGLARQLKALYRRRDSQTFANISTYEAGFRSSSNDGTEQKMIAYADLNAKIEEFEQRLAAEDGKTKAVLDNLTDTPIYWAVLKDRYIDRLGWSQIAKAYSYSEQHIFRIHGRALQEVCRFVPEDEDER